MRVRRKGLEWLPLVVDGTTYAVRLDHGCPGRPPPGCQGRWTATAHGPLPEGDVRAWLRRAGDPGSRFPPVVAVSVGDHRAPVLRALRERVAAALPPPGGRAGLAGPADPGRPPGPEASRSRYELRAGRPVGRGGRSPLPPP